MFSDKLPVLWLSIYIIIFQSINVCYTLYILMVVSTKDFFKGPYSSCITDFLPGILPWEFDLHTLDSLYASIVKHVSNITMKLLTLM